MARSILKLALAALAAFAAVAQGQTAYPLFAPANGVLKGDVNTFVTTTAAATDVASLWSNGCDATKWLRGDGVCSLLSTTGAGITKTDDTNVTLTFGGTPATAVLNALSLTLGWTGTLAPARGGLGFSTVTDDTIPIANGTLWQSKAIPVCTDTAGNHLNYDTSTNTISCGTSSSSAGVAVANPTGLIGMTTVNGVAATALRSDGLHAIDPAIAPTWTGSQLFSGLTNTGVGTTGTSLGQLGGTDAALEFTNAGNAANTRAWQIRANNNDLLFRVNTDVGGTSDWLKATRSTAAVASLNFGNATDNPTYSFLGTGATTFGGAVATSNAAGGLNWFGPDNTATAANLSVGTNVVAPSASSSRGSLFINGATEALLEFGANETSSGFLFASSAELRFSAGTSRVVTLYSNAILRTTIATDGGLFMAGASGSSQGSGTINATGLFVNGVAVSTGSAATKCSTACNVSTIAVGQTFYINPTSTATRTSTVTSTSDADLQFTNIPVGSYSVTGTLIFTGSVGGSRLTYTLTSGTGQFDTAGSQACLGVATTAVALGSSSAEVTCASSTTNYVATNGFARIATTATVALQWSQNTSNVTPTTRTADSFIYLTRIK